MTRPSPHLDVTVMLLRRSWTSALDSARRGGCLALSQRVGELKADYIIADRWVRSMTGARYKEYKILGRKTLDT